MISFIIPTYNRAEYLKQLLLSITKFKYNYEIIIIDDNSQDNTEEIVNEFSFQLNNFNYIKNLKKEGPSFNRELGMKISKYSYIVFVDDDDFYEDVNLFIKAVKELDLNDNLSFYSFNGRILKNNSEFKHELDLEGFIERKYYLSQFQIFKNKPLSTFTTLFNKLKLGTSGINLYNDSSIYLRSLLVGDCYLNKEFIGYYRIHDSNITNNLNVKFIIENLEEKIDIYKNYKINFNLKRSWIVSQIEMTINYFIKNNKINIVSFLFLNLYLVKKGFYINVFKNFRNHTKSCCYFH